MKLQIIQLLRKLFSKSSDINLNKLVSKSVISVEKSKKQGKNIFLLK